MSVYFWMHDVYIFNIIYYVKLEFLLSTVTVRFYNIALYKSSITSISGLRYKWMTLSYVLSIAESFSA